jgi:hypothetical protein
MTCVVLFHQRTTRTSNRDIERGHKIPSGSKKYRITYTVSWFELELNGQEVRSGEWKKVRALRDDLKVHTFCHFLHLSTFKRSPSIHWPWLFREIWGVFRGKNCFAKYAKYSA